MAKGKMISVRVASDQAQDLEVFADFDGVAVAEEVRRAIELLLEQKKKDPEFVARVRAKLEQSRSLLEKLGESQVADHLELAEPVAAVRAARRHH